LTRCFEPFKDRALYGWVVDGERADRSCAASVVRANGDEVDAVTGEGDVVVALARVVVMLRPLTATGAVDGCE
jgi:hypothetical protein